MRGCTRCLLLMVTLISIAASCINAAAAAAGLTEGASLVLLVIMVF